MVDLAQTIEEWKDLQSVKVDDQVIKLFFYKIKFSPFIEGTLVKNTKTTTGEGLFINYEMQKGGRGLTLGTSESHFFNLSSLIFN